MPQEKDLKRLVRQRVAETGERYTAARASIEGKPVAGGSGDFPSGTPVPSAEDSRERSAVHTIDDLLALAVHGIRAEHVRAYRRIVPGMNLGDLEDLWIHGVTPEVAERYGAAGLTVHQMLEAAVHGLSPEDVEDFAELLKE